MDTGAWLRQARQTSGLSYVEAAYRLRDVLPEPYWVSFETIRRAEKRSDPDPLLVAALASVYGIGTHDLPEEVEVQLEGIRVLLGVGGPERDPDARPAVAFKSPFGEPEVAAAAA